MTLAQSSINQDNASAKDLHDSSLLQSTDTNIDGSNRIHLGNIENPYAEIIQKMHVVPYHSRYKDYKISEIIEDLIDNTTVAHNARSELEEDRSLTSEINSHSKDSISQESKTQHSSDNTRRSIKKSSNSDGNLNYKSNSEEAPVKEYPGQPNLSRNDKEKSSKGSKRHDEKIVTTKPLPRKSKEERDDAGEKNTTERPLNHRRSSSRWGMSILSSPPEFLENKFRPLHQKNKEHTEGKKDGRHDLVGRSGMSVISLPKEFLDDTLMHRTYGARSLSVKADSRPSQIKGSSDHQSLANASHQNSQADSTQQLMIDNNKELTETLYEKIPNNLYPSRYLKLNWNNYRPYDDLNNRLLLRNLKFLTQALQSYIEQNM